MLPARSISEPESPVLLALAALCALLIRAMLARQKGAAMISRPNVHRRSRRVLGSGQVPQLTPITITATGSGSTAILVFSKSVVVTGNLPLTVATRTFVSQVVNSANQVTVTMSGAVTGLAYALAANTPNLKGFDGSVNSALAGTFP